jgi:hypothetical protein
MRSTPRAAAAALIRERAPAILPRVVADAAAGDASEHETLELQRRLMAFLERRIPPWIEALEADNSQRREAILRMFRMQAAAAEPIPPVVLLGTVAIGYRVMEAEIRSKAEGYGHSAEELLGEVDVLRRVILEMKRGLADGGRVA